MAKLTLSTISSRYASVGALNSNNDAIEEALENTLSRDGTAPNYMAADLDMNSQRILNLPDPTTDSEPATKGWVEAQPGSAAADAVAAASSAATATAAAATIAGFEWESQWLTATAYAVNNLVYEAGNTYICLVAHTSGTFGTDFGAGKWELFAAKGAAGAGTGDMLGSNNLSDLTNFATARATLGVPASADIGVTIQPYDADTLKADTADTLTAGFAATPYNAGTKSSGTFTLNEANGNFQHCVNGGAFTLAPPTNDCTIVLQVTNNASAGTITTSGFTKVTGSSITTTDGHDFFMFITKCNGFSHLAVQALQ